MSKKTNPIVFVPSYTDFPAIKEQISQNSMPQYEAQGVKYQGFYRNPYTKEVRTQAIKKYYGAISNTNQQINFNLTKKRFIITNLTIFYQITAVAAGSPLRNIQLIQDYTGTINEFRHDITLTNANVFCSFDFSSSPITITNSSFSMLINSGLNANDIISVTIAGFEED